MSIKTTLRALSNLYKQKHLGAEGAVLAESKFVPLMKEILTNYIRTEKELKRKQAAAATRAFLIDREKLNLEEAHKTTEASIPTGRRSSMDAKTPFDSWSTKKRHSVASISEEVTGVVVPKKKVDKPSYEEEVSS